MGFQVEKIIEREMKYLKRKDEFEGYEKHTRNQRTGLGL